MFCASPGTEVPRRSRYRTPPWQTRRSRHCIVVGWCRCRISDASWRRTGGCEGAGLSLRTARLRLPLVGQAAGNLRASASQVRQASRAMILPDPFWRPFGRAPLDIAHSASSVRSSSYCISWYGLHAENESHPVSVPTARGVHGRSLGSFKGRQFTERWTAATNSSKISCILPSCRVAI